MDIKKFQDIAQKIAQRVPDGQNQDINHMFQHTTQVVMEMMQNGELDSFMSGLGIPQQTIDEIEDEEDEEEDEDSILPKKNSLNLKFDLNVSLKELYTGKRKKIHVKRKIIKDGQIVKEKKKFCVPIHPGMTDGEIIRFKGEGDQEQGYRPGDIIIRICETNETDFERMGEHLVLTKTISLSEAFCLKCSIEFIDGRVIYIESDEPVNTNDSRRKIKGYGMPIYDETTDVQEYGDLFIIFTIEYPTNVDDKYYEKLREIFPPLNKITSTENKQELEDLTDYDRNFFYEYYGDEEDTDDEDEEDEDDDEDEEDDDTDDEDDE